MRLRACSHEKRRSCSLWASLSKSKERSGGKRRSKASTGPKGEMREASLRKVLPRMDFWWWGARRWEISDSDILQPVSVCLHMSYSPSPCFSRPSGELGEPLRWGSTTWQCCCGWAVLRAQAPTPEAKGAEKASPARTVCSQVTPGHRGTTQEFSETSRRTLKV